MSHVSFVSMSGFRVRESELAELGMSLPGLRDRASAISALPPLGVLTLAGMTPSDWSVSLHEPKQITDHLVSTIIDEKPTIVAISSLTASIDEAYRLSDRLRIEGLRVVIGGLHVTVSSEEAQKHCDAVAVGEGEGVWLDILRDAQRGTLQNQYKAAKPFDLAQSPLPRFDLLGSDRQRYTLQTSRGCPFACDFCGASRLLGPYRRKPNARLAEELNAISQIINRPIIELADDNTFAAGGDHHELLDAMAASGARWFTEADWRLGENAAVLDRLAEAGCVQVLVGLESIIHRYGGMGAKAAPVTRMNECVQAIQQTGVAVIGCYVAGADGETEQTIEQLGTTLNNSPCADIQVTVQTPFPGTGLRKRLANEGRLLPNCGWSSMTLFDVAYQPDRMSALALENRFAELLTRVYGEKPTRRRNEIRRNVWAQNPALRKRANR